MNVRNTLIVALCAANIAAGVSLWSKWASLSEGLGGPGESNPLPTAGVPTLVIAADPQTLDVSGVIREVRQNGKVADVTVVVIVPDDVIAPNGDFVGADSLLYARQLPESSRSLADAWNTWVLFDRTNELVDRGPLDGTGLVGVLQTRILGEPDLAERAALLMHEAFQEGSLRPIDRFAPGPHAILLLSKVGAACGTGEALRRVGELRDAQRAAVAVMLPNSWSTREVLALQSAFGLAETPERAHPDLERRWKSLEQTFGENRTAGILIWLDEEGVKTVFTDRIGILDGLEGVLE